MNARKWSVAVLGMWLGWSVPAFGQDTRPGATKPVPLEANRMPTQLPDTGTYQPPTLAQTIARTLKESGQLSRYQVNVMAQNGTVDLVGEVADESQRELVAKLVRATPGVVVV